VRRGRLAITAALACGIAVLTGGSARAGTTDPGQSGTPSTVVYETVKFPKTGGGSYAISRGGDDSATGAIAVEFVSGLSVVVLNTFGNDASPSSKELKAIARKAEKRARRGVS
jgi:hypothetical protein